MNHIFISVHHLDFKSGMVHTLHASEGVDDVPGKTHSYDDFMELCAMQYHTEDSTRFLKEFSLNALYNEKLKEVSKYERDYRRKINGSYLWISNCLYLNGNFDTDTAVLVQMDVSDRHRSSDIIQALGEEYFALYYVDLLTDTAQFFRSDCRVVDKLGLTVHSAFSQKLAEYCSLFVHPDDRAAFRKYIDYNYLRNHLTAANRSIVMPYRKKADNDYQWVEMRLAVTEHFEKIPRYITLAIRNIDDAIQQELNTKSLLEDTLKQAEKASNAKSDFLSKISHDIRTPMNAIMGMISLAGSYENDPEKLRNCLNKIHVSSSHLLGLINEILDMNRIESGKIDLDSNEFDIGDLLRNTVAIIYPSIKEKRLKLILHDEKIFHPQVIGDSVRLQQVFTNILSNAVKYTPANGTIEVTLDEIPWALSGTGRYRFICRDTGIGIAPEFIPHIFEPFTREQDSRINKISGTGLGMTITQSIIKMMNGDIHIDSTLGAGSTFTLTFTLTLTDQHTCPELIAAEEELLSSSNSIISQQQFFGRRFLLVDDNELNLEIIQEMMALAGAETHISLNGQEALTEYLSKPNGYYDLILMDVQMPVMNGLEAARLIRSSDHLDAAEIPIIALTANTFAEDVRLGTDAGITAYMPKPVNLQKMIQLIERVLELES